MQLSTVLSDGVLALACLAGSVWLLRSARFSPAQQATQLAAVGGLLLTALTATCGSLRFAGLDGLTEWHRDLSNASGAIGLPLLGLAALVLSRQWPWALRRWSIVLALLASAALLAELSGLRTAYGLLINLASLCLLLLAGLFQRPRTVPISLSGSSSGLFLLAGLLVGSQGSIGPFLRVDLFHALLMPAYLLISWLMIVLASTESPAKTL